MKLPSSLGCDHSEADHGASEELKDTHGLSFILSAIISALVQVLRDKVLVLYDGKVVESGKLG